MENGRAFSRNSRRSKVTKQELRSPQPRPGSHLPDALPSSETCRGCWVTGSHFRNPAPSSWENMASERGQGSLPSCLLPNPPTQDAGWAFWELGGQVIWEGSRWRRWITARPHSPEGGCKSQGDSRLPEVPRHILAPRPVSPPFAGPPCLCSVVKSRGVLAHDLEHFSTCPEIPDP